MTDKTGTKRMQKRQAALKKAALAAGWDSWSAFETAVIRNRIKIPKNPEKKGVK
jgi:hypothetical protein